MQRFKVLFLGLGRMGFHMAAHLSKSKNIELFIHNRSSKKVNDWLKFYKAKKFDFRNQTNLQFDIIITCLKDDFSINQLTNSLIRSSCFHKKTIFIDHSTISLDQVEKLNKLLSIHQCNGIIEHAVAEAPFVVIPSHYFNQTAVNTCLCRVKVRREWVVVKVDRYQWLMVNSQHFT